MSKSKWNVLIEKAAQDYADKIANSTKSISLKKGVSVDDLRLNELKEFAKSSFIAGECHMYNLLLGEVTKKKAP